MSHNVTDVFQEQWECFYYFCKYWCTTRCMPQYIYNCHTAKLSVHVFYIYFTEPSLASWYYILQTCYPQEGEFKYPEKFMFDTVENTYRWIISNLLPDFKSICPFYRWWLQHAERNNGLHRRKGIYTVSSWWL